MKKHDLMSSTVFFAIGLFIISYAPEFGLGSLSAPGPGFMPFLAGLIICGFSAITFLGAFLDKSAEVQEIWAKIKFQRLILTILMLVAYTLLVKRMGFLICTFILILIIMRYVAYQSWFKSILSGVLSSILAYVLFETWLKAQLPKGILGL